METKEITERYWKAQQLVSDLCEGKREWIMRIPAEPDYDPDLVIGASLADIPKLVALVEELESELFNISANTALHR